MEQSPKDRRQAPRYAYPATAVIKTGQGLEASGVRVLGIGISGCRIAVSRRLDEGQEFELTIRPNGVEIVVKVVVVYWHKKGFAGLHFTALSPESKERLKRLIEQISKTAFELET